MQRLSGRVKMDRNMNMTMENYQAGVACAEEAERLIRAGQYEEADAFLAEKLYDRDRERAKVMLTERSMVLKLLNEILLCEKNHGADHPNTWERCKENYQIFFELYQKTKRMVRRIWLGFDEKEQSEVNSLLDTNPMSGDCLAVIAKYSVSPEYWGSLFARLAELLEDRHSAVQRMIHAYFEWMKREQLCGDAVIVSPRTKLSGWDIRKLDYSREEAPVYDIQEDKIAVVFCTNDDGYATECRKYLEYLRLPEGMSGEILEIWNAPGMAAGYNYAMGHTDAKYKLYIHHDSFLIKTDLIRDIVTHFRKDSTLGAIGVAGSLYLPASGKWYQADYEKCILTLWQDAVLDFVPPKRQAEQRLLDADAIDGVLIATSVDSRWNEELFDGWHYYDISKCWELRRAGFRTVLAEDREPWLLHEITMRKDPKDLYGVYGNIFRREYLVKGI